MDQVFLDSCIIVKYIFKQNSVVIADMLLIFSFLVPFSYCELQNRLLVLQNDVLSCLDFTP